MKVVRVALGAAVMASLLLSSVASGAPRTPAGGKIKIFVANPDALRTRVLVTGAIGDYGTAISQNKNGKPNINGAFEKFTLKQGGFTVDATALYKVFPKVKPKVNLSTCSVELAGSAPAPVIDGTGLYAGISGKLKLSFDFAFIAPRKNGKCNVQGKQVAGYDTVSATGTVSFS